MTNKSPLTGGSRRRRGRRGGRAQLAPPLRPRRRRSRRWAFWLVVPLVAAGVVAVWLLAGESATSDVVSPHPTKPVTGRRLHVTTPRPADAGPPGIQLFGAKPIRVHLANPPKAGLLFDLRTGQVLWARNPLKKLPIASVTKVMSAIIDVERTQPNDQVKITREAEDAPGSRVGELPRHKSVSAEALLAGMLLPSGNDAAVAMADHVAGSDSSFARLMNERAKAMGLGCTHYVSSYGLQTQNRSCAADLAALARVAMSKPRIVRLTRQFQVHVRFPIKTGKLWLTTTNPLLHLRYPGTIGLKTGTTNAAGDCFIGVIRRAGRELGVVLLHSPNTGEQAQKLFDAALRQRA